MAMGRNDFLCHSMVHYGYLSEHAPVADQHVMECVGGIRQHHLYRGQYPPLRHHPERVQLQAGDIKDDMTLI